MQLCIWKTTWCRIQVQSSPRSLGSENMKSCICTANLQTTNPTDLNIRKLDHNPFFHMLHQFNTSQKLKLSHHRPGHALMIPGGRVPRIYGISAHEGGKVVNLTHRPPLTPREYPWYLVLSKLESTPEAMTPSGNDLAIFRLIAQSLNQLCQCVAIL